jgi:hypothetical protein
VYSGGAPARNPPALRRGATLAKLASPLRQR